MDTFSLHRLVLWPAFFSFLSAFLVVADISTPYLGDASKREVCMKELGCFSIPDDFKHLLYRPFNVLPNRREVINTKFILYTRAQPKEGTRLRASDKNIDRSGIVPSHPTKFIVHGFMDHTLYGPWMEEMKDEFLLSSDHNVIIVDWGGGNMPPYYQAVANTRVVGAEIAHLIQTLEEKVGLKRENCHILGHSLGSHIAGYAGERLKTLGRITGLDPAEPYFQNMPPSVRLDPTDADFVDVIHSDSRSIALLGFGMSQLCGHVDFFPNDGKSQPGCHTERIISFIFEGLIEGVRRFVACNHQRAVDFYMHSINFRSVKQVSYSCHSWSDFLEAKCADCGANSTRCAILGERAIEYRPHKNAHAETKLYLKTSGIKPFWIYHYQVTVRLHRTNSAAVDQKGKLELTLIGEDSDETFMLTDGNQYLVHGSQYLYLVTTGKKIGKLIKASLRWRSALFHNFFRSRDLYVEFVKVSPMDVISREERKLHERTFCDSPENPVRNKETRHLLKTNC